ncbi:MAG: hypothetical protein K2W96_03230 [Gemmataceae bacterium]|nr:hypothetical protein [Gemmataceae bacterium]
MIHAMLLGLALAAPAPGDAEPDDVVKDRKAFIPHRKHDPLKGKTVALLVNDVRAYMGFDGRGGPPDAMGLSVANNSYRWIYVPTPDAASPLISGLNVEVGEKGGKKKVYAKLGMANPVLAKAWGINVPYSLVEVEVNDGEGAPPGEAFVATKATRLDGTKEYPLDATKTVEALRKRWADDKKGVAKKVEAVMAAEAKKILKDRKATGPRETAELEYMTWLPEAQRMRVAFRARVTDGAFTFIEVGGGRGGPFPLPPPPGAGPRPAALFFPPPPPRGIKVKTGAEFGVEYGFAYEVDKSGKVVKRQELKPEGFSRELPIPLGGPGRLGGPRRED